MELTGLSTKTLGRTLIHLPVVDSTNNYLKERGDHMPDLAVVIADSQTAGKGRLGRHWASQPGSGLYCSVFLRELPPQLLTSLPLVAALAVHEALTGLCGVPFGIKWSNDILHRDRKLCGILCESRGDSHRMCGVIGIGVNLTQTDDELRRLGLVYATSLRLATNRSFSPETVACGICNALEPALHRFFAEGFGPVMDEYRAHCVTLGRSVTLLRGGAEVPAAALDIAPDGSLLCNLGGRLTAVSAGEVRMVAGR